MPIIDASVGYHFDLAQSHRVLTLDNNLTPSLTPGPCILYKFIVIIITRLSEQN